MLLLSRKLLISFCLVLPLPGFTQSGKLNVSADSSTAIKSIRYKSEFVTNLPTAVTETSGLIVLNGMLWTINDSGNPAEIYQIDSTSGAVIRKVVIRNAVNTDWEAITQDDSNIYIGDFGNNPGNRTDLRILKIPKNCLSNNSDSIVQAGYIHFRYPDQFLFKSSFNKNNFDCEAFFYRNDSLHLFSKDWSDLQTRHYILPADTGNYTAKLVEKFNADGLITDASINKKGNIILLGYKNTGGNAYSCFCWLISGYKDCSFFSGKKSRVELGSAVQLGQSEGIMLNEDNSAWLTSESINFSLIHHPAKLFKLYLGNYF
jgi:hypothetical protein